MTSAIVTAMSAATSRKVESDTGSVRAARFSVSSSAAISLAAATWSRTGLDVGCVAKALALPTVSWTCGEKVMDQPTLVRRSYRSFRLVIRPTIETCSSASRTSGACATNLANSR